MILTKTITLNKKGLKNLSYYSEKGYDILSNEIVINI